MKPNNKLLLAFDFGMKNIGVAIGQQITGTASALSVLKAKDGIPNWCEIKFLLKEWQPYYVIVGLPLNMDGTKQSLTFKTYKFINQIHNLFNIHVEVQDERLSTVDARSKLFACGGYRMLQKDQIHSQSAVIILQDWFTNPLNINI